LDKCGSQTRLRSITVADGKSHRGAVKPQNEVLAYLHQSHRSGRRKRDSAQTTVGVSRATEIDVEREVGREGVIDDGVDPHDCAAYSSGASTRVMRPVFEPRLTMYRVTSSS
jgi:hypothetical protein